MNGARETALEAAYVFIKDKLLDQHKEKGAVGVFCAAFRQGYDAGARAPSEPAPPADTRVLEPVAADGVGVAWRWKQRMRDEPTEEWSEWSPWMATETRANRDNCETWEELWEPLVPQSDYLALQAENERLTAEVAEERATVVAIVAAAGLRDERHDIFDHLKAMRARLASAPDVGRLDAEDGR